MRLIGFNFNKISAEAIKNIQKGFKINSNIDIDVIEKADLDMFKSKNEELISIQFKYLINYEPGYAKININGGILITLDSKEAKELLKRWKDKEIPEDLRISLFNIILQKSSIKALQLEDDMGFPFHIPFPRFTKQDSHLKD
jgi:hypothetical protein